LEFVDWPKNRQLATGIIGFIISMLGCVMPILSPSSRRWVLQGAWAGWITFC
jgi:hypothetical protein